jgi:hypothetical protein
MSGALRSLRHGDDCLLSDEYGTLNRLAHESCRGVSGLESCRLRLEVAYQIWQTVPVNILAATVAESEAMFTAGLVGSHRHLSGPAANGTDKCRSQQSLTGQFSMSLETRKELNSERAITNLVAKLRGFDEHAGNG